MVVNSTAALQSYRFSLDMEQSMDLVNLSSGEAQELDYHLYGLRLG